MEQWGWNSGTLHVAKMTLGITVLDVDLHSLLQAFSSDINPVELFFFMKVFVAMAGVLAFLTCALTHRFPVVVLVFSTFGVIPVFRQLVSVFACRFRRLYLSPGSFFELECFEGHHLFLASVVAFVAFLYLLMLVPFTAAEGDLSVMPQHVLLQPQEWVRRKLDKKMGLNLGGMSPSRAGVVQAAYVNFFASLALTTIATLHVWMSPVVQAVLSLCTACIPIGVALLWPPMYNALAGHLVALGHSFAAIAFLSGLFSILVNNTESPFPVVFLISGWVAIVVAAITLIRRNVIIGKQHGISDSFSP